MDSKNIISEIVVLAVCAVIFGAGISIITAINDDQSVKFDNLGAGNVRVSAINNDTTIVYSSPTITIGSNAYTFSSTCSYIADTGFIYHGSGGGAKGYFVNDAGVYSTIDYTEDYSVSIDYEDKTIIITSTNGDINTTFEWCYVYNPTGSNVWVDSNFSRTFNINSISQIHSIEYRTDGHIYSTAGDVLKVNNEVDGQVNYSLNAVNGYANLYTIYIQKTASGSNYTYSYDGQILTPHWTIVPLSVYAVTSEISPVIDIINLLPLIMGAGLVIFAIGLIVYRKL